MPTATIIVRIPHNCLCKNFSFWIFNGVDDEKFMMVITIMMMMMMMMNDAKNMKYTGKE